MGLFHRGKSKKELLEWQKLILPESNKLIWTEQQLLANTENICNQSLKIIQDSVKLVNTTKNPEVFFMRYDLMCEHTRILSVFEPYIKFSGTSPTKLLEEWKSQKQQAIRDFLERYYQVIYEKQQTIKTEKSKQNQIIKFKESLMPYWDQMDEYNQDFIEKEYTAKILRTRESLKETK